MYLVFKRMFDIILSVIMLILFAIPMLIISILIKIEDNGPIIYKSKRVGKRLKVFNTYKFRTMKTNRKELESTLSHDEMVTKVGKVLRKTSLDELPQLINIIRGQMSFIGPRPWIPEYYEWFNKEQKRRASVLPGVSGLAQINGRNGIDVLQKINYDLEYINNRCFKLDAKIFYKSVVAVFQRKNAEISETGIKKEINQLKKIRENVDNLQNINI